MTYFSTFFIALLLSVFTESLCENFSLSINELLEIERDAKFLTQNVNAISAGVGQYVGSMVLFGKHAFPLATIEKDDLHVWAMSRLAGGKICAFSQTKFCQLNDVQLSLFDNEKMIENCIKWVSNKSASSAESLSPATGMITTTATFNSRSFRRATKTNFRDETDLAGVDFVVLYDTYLDSRNKINVLKSFLKKGGGLIICSTPWNKSDMTTLPGNLLLFDAGIVWRSDIYRSQSPIPVKPISVKDDLWRQNHWYSAVSLLSNSNGQAKTLRRQNGVQSKLNSTEMLFAELLENIPKFLISNQPNPFSAEFFRVIGSMQIYNEHCLHRNLLDFPVNQMNRPMEYYCIKLTNFIKYLLPANREHPIVKAARRFPGYPTGNRAEEKTISRTLSVSQNKLQSMDIYVWPGSTLQILIPNNYLTQENVLEIQIGSHSDNLMEKIEFKRWPVLTETTPLHKSNTTVYTLTGGLIYLNVKTVPNPSVIAQQITFIGEIVSSPRFILGLTSDSDWQRDISVSKSPWLEIETDYLIVTLPAPETKRWIQNITEVAQWQNAMMKMFYDLSGRPPNRYKDRFVPDMQVNRGNAHAGYPIMVAESWDTGVLPDKGSWSRAIITPSPNVIKLRSDFLDVSHWGIFHEIGHNFQEPIWTSQEELEVTGNIFALYLEETYPSGPNQFGARKLDPDSRKSLPLFYQMLGFYVDLRLAFGWEAFRRFFRHFSDNDQQKKYTLIEVNDNWLKYFSQVVKRDISHLMKSFNKTFSENAKTSASQYPIWNVDSVVDCETAAFPGQSPCATFYVRPDGRSMLYRMVTWSRIHDRERLVLSFEGIQPPDSLKGFTVVSQTGGLTVESSHYNATLRKVSIQMTTKINPFVQFDLLLTPIGSVDQYSFDSIKVKVKIMAGNTIAHVQERYLEGVRKKIF